MAPGKDQAKIQELSSVHELKEWLIGRVADDNDIVIDELQEEHADMFEMEDEKRGIKVGKKTSIQCIFFVLLKYFSYYLKS